MMIQYLLLSTSVDDDKYNHQKNYWAQTIINNQVLSLYKLIPLFYLLQDFKEL